MNTFSRSIRARMLFRSFSVQGSWNYETLIGAGFAFTILPALRHLYGPSGERLEAAVTRHEELFNSHPYLVTVAVGAVSKLESLGTDPAVIQRFKTALRGSLGSMGDQLVWGTWRPMSVLLGLVLLMAGAAWWLAIVAFLLVYNSLHLTVRVLGLQAGTVAGFEIGRMLRESPLQRIIEAGSRAACLLIGSAVILAAAPTVHNPKALFLTIGSVVLGFSLGMRARRVMIAVLAGVATLALAYGMFWNGA